MVCFDEINEQSKKVAKDFGIPIIYFNKREIAEREAQKLNKTMEIYSETKDIKLLKNIIGTYLNNTTSFSFDRPDLVEEFFNVENMNSEL